MPPTYHWIFDTLPPSGARRGGDPSEHAFKHDLATFVREVIQNANDQATGTPVVALDLLELQGEALEGFLQAMAWDDLRAHLQAEDHTRTGRRVTRHLTEIKRTGRLLLMSVADRNTVGLTGGEDDDESHFRALCKDTLFSHKRRTSAGGSYGLGKSVLWAFSGLSTVLFASRLQHDPPDHASPRLIGRTELPSHELDGVGYMGTGWFGVPAPAKVASGLRAVSVWGKPAEALAKKLHLVRGAETGTTISIVGFRDPTNDAEASPDELRGAIRSHAAANFWPAMQLKQRRLRVEVDGMAIDPQQVDAARPFVACWQGRERPVEKLEAPGDVVVRPIPIEIPRQHKGHGPVSGHVDLIVRLAEEGSAESGIGQVAAFRGAGMVVRYWDYQALASALRPFHAVLACGEGRTEEPSDADRLIEQFLRLAEPPGHDEWGPTPLIKDTYIRGYAKALERLRGGVLQGLREVLAPAASQGLQGPERLRRRFPIGRRGSEGSAPSAFLFDGLTARFDGQRWSFSGSLRPAKPGPPWCATISLHELGEDGKALGKVDIAEIITGKGVAVSVDEAGAHLDVKAGVAAVSFEGISRPLPATAEVGELALDVSGELLGGPTR